MLNLTRSIWKMLGPFATTSRLTPIHQMSLAVLSRAACASMSTTTTTTTRDRGDRNDNVGIRARKQKCAATRSCVIAVQWCCWWCWLQTFVVRTRPTTSAVRPARPVWRRLARPDSASTRRRAAPSSSVGRRVETRSPRRPDARPLPTSPTRASSWRGGRQATSARRRSAHTSSSTSVTWSDRCVMSASSFY